MSKPDGVLEAIEVAMVRIRRRQMGLALAMQTGEREHGPYRVLDVVEAAEESGSPVTVSVVADVLQLDQPRASRLVAAAVEAGLVRREADQADGRRSLLVRTRAGRTASEEMHKFRRTRFAKAMSGWTAAEREIFADLLTRFVESVGR